MPNTDRAPASPIGGRSYTAGKYALDIGGATAGWVNSAEGGHATSDVVTEKLGPDHVAHKHLAGVKYEDISISAGTGMSKYFYDWIAASWNQKYARLDGAITTADHTFNVLQKLEFFHALITETGLPALDASSKEAALIDVSFAPEFTRLDRKVTGTLTANTTKQKLWLVSNFRLAIGGLDCTKVSKVEALVVKQKFVEGATGENRDYQREPASVEFPNLVVTLAAASADTWYDWFEDFLIKGNNGADKEKTGTLEYLSPTLSEVLFTVNFFGLGIFKLEPDNGAQNADNILRLRAEMYVENMTFARGSGVTA